MKLAKWHAFVFISSNQTSFSFFSLYCIFFCSPNKSIHNVQSCFYFSDVNVGLFIFRRTRFCRVRRWWLSKTLVCFKWWKGGGVWRCQLVNAAEPHSTGDLSSGKGPLWCLCRKHTKHPISWSFILIILFCLDRIACLQWDNSSYGSALRTLSFTSSIQTVCPVTNS